MSDRTHPCPSCQRDVPADAWAPEDLGKHGRCCLPCQAAYRASRLVAPRKPGGAPVEPLPTCASPDCASVVREPGALCVGHRAWAIPKAPPPPVVRVEQAQARPLHRWQVRAAALGIYGGACSRCGSSEDLEFDHVNDDGLAHRAIETLHSMLHRIVRTGAPLTDWDLQILCRPCHRWKTHGIWPLASAATGKAAS